MNTNKNNSFDKYRDLSPEECAKVASRGKVRIFLIYTVALILIGVWFLRQEFTIIPLQYDYDGPLTYEILNRRFLVTFVVLVVLALMVTILALFMQELSFVGIFNAKCDPARYLEAELIRSSKRPARARSRGIRLNIAIAYEALGDHENAWKYLKDLIPADPGKLNKVRLLGILASYYRETGDRQTSDIYKARLEAIRASGKRNPGVELSLDNLNIPDAIEGKKYDEARELIGKYINSNRISLYNRTIMNYYLGLIAFETNEHKEAIYRLMTALENGSKLPLAQKAQEMLDSL